MFVEHPSMKKGMLKAGKTGSAPKGKESMGRYSGESKSGMKNTMEHCSKLLSGRSLEPKQRNGSAYFPDPKGHK
jgi:hypothetical protein